MTTGMRELTEGSEITYDERGITAIKVFLYDPTDTQHTEDLPKIGEDYTDSLLLEDPSAHEITYESLLCRRITRTTVAADKRILQYTCYYNNEPTDPSQFSESGTSTAGENLPINLEYSGEIQMLNPDQSSGWKWDSDNTTVIQPIPFKVGTSTLRISRIVLDKNYRAYVTSAKKLLGKINSENNYPLNDGVGNWIFSSVNTEMFRDFKDEKKWRVELIFTYRNPEPDTPSKSTYGWNKILRINGNWDSPKKAGSDYLYGTGVSFNALFA